jgi:hypothetical protein
MPPHAGHLAQLAHLGLFFVVLTAFPIVLQCSPAVPIRFSSLFRLLLSSLRVVFPPAFATSYSTGSTIFHNLLATSLNRTL